MKRLWIIALLILFFSPCSRAQLLKRLVSNAKNSVENVAGRKIDKAVESTIDGKTSTDNAAPNTANNDLNDSRGAGLKAYSKFDFVPGDHVLYAEDFSQDAIGEFPKLWNTNNRGEIVTIDGLAGNWLHLKENTRYDAPHNKPLPANYTLEYDVILDYKDNTWYIPALNTSLSSQQVEEKGLKFSFTPGWRPHDQNLDLFTLTTTDNSNHTYLKANDQVNNLLTANNHKSIPLHIALWVQQERVRLWVNQEKIYDLPKAMATDVVPAFLSFSVTPYKGPASDFNYYITNIKIAEALPDTRNKLLTEGKWVTSGIQFDVNSDGIKPQSYEVLKEIADLLKDNTTIRIKIIGHTDSDGDATKNLDLSRRRAASVKLALANEFNIDSSRMETDGMGSSQPVADNKKPEGKAQNRRVEFLKL
ncbi:MAG: OmpA family protein [Bacteroidia bacterium]